MQTHQQASGTAQMAKSNSAYLKVLDMLMVFASKWYWFIICLLVALAICYFYLAMTPPIYTRSASILIKNEAQSATSDMKFLENSVDVNNELFTLKSPNIAKAAVLSLHLEVRCFAQGRFHEEAIYGTQLGVQFLPLDLNDLESAEFFFDLKKDGTFVMDNFSRNGTPVAGALRGKLGQTVKSPIGNIEVKKTPNYQPHEIALRVERVSISEAVNHTISNLSVSAVSEMSTIINL